MSPSALDRLVKDPPIPRYGAGASKLLDLQILRAMAASLVVIDHVTLSLGIERVPTGRYHNPALLIGHIGVAAFFILSGLIMVRQSANLFGRPLGPAHFFYRRLTRIAPMYYIATFVWLIFTGVSAYPHLAGQLANALLFIPNFYAKNIFLTPILLPGWSLNLEMAFYILLTLALLLPRRAGLVAVLLVLEGINALGRSHYFPPSQTPYAILGFYTSGYTMLFAHGVLIGWLEVEFKQVRRFAFPFAPALLLLLPPAVMLIIPGRFGRLNDFDLLDFYVLLVVLLSVLAAPRRMSLLRKSFVLLGDASYSTYLFHLFVTGRVAIIAAQYLHGAQIRPLPYLAVLVAAVLLANLAGLILHLALERPLIGVFRRVRLPAFASLEAH